MAKPKFYTVHAYRFGDRERHSYSVGVYNKKSKALKGADIEEEYRGGKYLCEVLECNINEGIEGRTLDKQFHPKKIKSIDKRGY